jgi:hypothetical protein
MSCKNCKPCADGRPCRGTQGMQGYGGVRRITNWGAANSGAIKIDDWIASDEKDPAMLATIMEESYFAEQDGIHGYDHLVALGVDLKAGTISKISYLNKVEKLLDEAGSTSALLVVTKVLTSYRKHAIIIGGGAMLAGIALSGGVSMTANKVDDYGHLASVAAIGWGSYTLAKAYGLI